MTEAQSQQHRRSDAESGIDKARASNANHLVEIHPKSQGHNGCFKKKLCQAFAFDMKRVCQGEAVNEAAEQSERRRDVTTGRQNQPGEENVLVHAASLLGG